MSITAGDKHVPVRFFCVFSSPQVQLQNREMLLSQRFEAGLSSLKESLFPHYTPCSFIGNVGCQYMVYVQSFPLT